MARYLFRDFLRQFERQSRLFDQHFILKPSSVDILMPLSVPGRHSLLENYYRWVESRELGSGLKVDKNTFRVELDVQHFKPEEVFVKVSDRFVTVEGEHEEMQDDQGYISRKFVRRYFLPEGFDANALASSLSSDGVLTLIAPKLPQVEGNERAVPITPTGEPHRLVKETPEPDKVQPEEKK